MWGIIKSAINSDLQMPLNELMLIQTLWMNLGTDANDNVFILTDRQGFTGSLLSSIGGLNNQKLRRCRTLKDIAGSTEVMTIIADSAVIMRTILDSPYAVGAIVGTAESLLPWLASSIAVRAIEASIRGSLVVNAIINSADEMSIIIETPSLLTSVVLSSSFRSAIMSSVAARSLLNAKTRRITTDMVASGILVPGYSWIHSARSGQDGHWNWWITTTWSGFMDIGTRSTPDNDSIEVINLFAHDLHFSMLRVPAQFPSDAARRAFVYAFTW